MSRTISIGKLAEAMALLTSSLLYSLRVVYLIPSY